MHISDSCSVMSDALWPHGLYIACQAPLSMEFSRQEYWSEVPFPSPNAYRVSSAPSKSHSLIALDSVWPHRRQPTRLPRPWDSPGKNTGVGCHFLLQCVKVKSESEVAQSCPTPSDPIDYSPPGSSAHGTFQARVLSQSLGKHLNRFHNS